MDFFNSSGWTFVVGLLILGLFTWYFATEYERRKRYLGTALSLVVLGFGLQCLLPVKETITLGLDLKGGVSFLLQLAPQEQQSQEGAQGEQEIYENEVTASMLDQAVAVIEKRVNHLGGTEPLIVPSGKDRILVQIPGLSDEKIAEARVNLQKVAKLEFKMVFPQSDQRISEIEAGTNIIPPGYRIEESVERAEAPAAPGEKAPEPKVERLLVKQRADLSGDRVASAFARYGPQGWEISLEFDGKGASQFGELTRQNVGNRLAIILDGKVMSAPVIRDAIYGGTAQITGTFTEEEARNLSSVLENPLRNPVKILDERLVSATLGTDSVQSGFFAGIVGLVGTLLTVLVYYRFPGIIANLALILNLVLLLAAMALFKFTLTLPGIAGIILSIGMAVDANVLIYERLREELDAGKSLKTAIASAYEKAFSAILDSNITTLITAAILFWQASGAVKGFAVTLIAGLLASMFSAILFTRVLFNWGTSMGWLKRVTMLDLMPKRKFNFVGMGRKALLISLLLVLGTVGYLAIDGARHLGVDFRGGDMVTIKARQMITEEEARAALASAGLSDFTVQIARSSEGEYLAIRSGQGTAGKIQETLLSKFTGADFSAPSVESVGPVVGRELAIKSGIALLLGMVGILVYVTARFEFSFAVGAIIALLHDVIITIGLFALFGREISMVFVGAILTIAGYSINDTIVVFDRIREGLLGSRRESVAATMNEAINLTLSRTILTGGTTLLSVLVLMFFGGPVLADFAIAILIGIIVGTYSSIFVASPLVLWWSRLTGRSVKEEVIETRTMLEKKA